MASGDRFLINGNPRLQTGAVGPAFMTLGGTVRIVGRTGGLKGGSKPGEAEAAVRGGPCGLTNKNCLAHEVVAFQPATQRAVERVATHHQPA